MSEFECNINLFGKSTLRHSDQWFDSTALYELERLRAQVDELKHVLRDILNAKVKDKTPAEDQARRVLNEMEGK